MPPDENPPEIALVAAIEAALGQRAERVDDLRALLEIAPRLLHDARLGLEDAADGSPRAIELLHSPEQQWAFWLELAALNPVGTVAMFPEATTTLAQTFGHLGDDGSRALGEAGVRTRVLTEADQLATPGVRAGMDVFMQLGVDARTVTRLPGFLVVVPRTLAVVPLDRGEKVPTSIAVTREPSVVAALLASFDELWTRARPLPGTREGVDPVLNLLAQGLSDAAIAAVLGQSLRTVRRRIGEATEAHGVSSRFALGVAWAGPEQ